MFLAVVRCEPRCPHAECEQQDKMKINVFPSDNIFQELGQNTYDYKDLLSELIDNSLAARDGKSVRVKVDLFVDKDQTARRFVISDDATGIPADKLGTAITPAGLKTDGSLNEHGLGMKQAIAAMGKLESLVTKTADTRVRARGNGVSIRRN
jgi:sensor histidine kinase regulating citrate/malate metabolism